MANIINNAFVILLNKLKMNFEYIKLDIIIEQKNNEMKYRILKLCHKLILYKMKLKIFKLL